MPVMGLLPVHVGENRLDQARFSLPMPQHGVANPILPDAVSAGERVRHPVGVQEQLIAIAN